MGYPDFSKPFEVHTNALNLGLGAILYQTEDGFKHVLVYASKSLTKAEKRYPVHKLENSWLWNGRGLKRLVIIFMGISL